MFSSIAWESSTEENNTKGKKINFKLSRILILSLLESIINR